MTSAQQIDANRLAVDIIVNNYNYARFVGDAVESALAQTHPNVRVIVVDDGSTDDSRNVLRAYEARVTLVLKENGGQASALNAGFARSTGDIVIFLDADDMIRPEAAALVARAFAADPRLAKVQYRMEVVDAAGRPAGVKPPSHLPLPSGDLRRAELVFPFDLVWMPNGASAFSADALRRILPVPEREFASCADWYVVHLAALLGPVASLDHVAACYRVHGGNRHEPQDATLDLEHVRRTVAYSVVTTRAIERLAAELCLERPYERILSVADLSNRLVSLKLERRLHPIHSDRIWSLTWDGICAAARRSDVSWPMKLLYVGWFAAMAAAPRPFGRALAEYLIFPQRRERLNRVFRAFHRWNGAEGAQQQEFRTLS